MVRRKIRKKKNYQPKTARARFVLKIVGIDSVLSLSDFHGLIF